MHNENRIDDAQIAAEMLLKVELEKLKLKAIKGLTRYLTLAAKILIIIVFGVAALTFGMLALGMFWGQAIGSIPLAFCYVSLICLGLLLILVALSKRMIGRPILKGLISEMFDEE